jgi:ribose 5-phosphate isomerase B
MKLIIGADHGGYILKNQVSDWLKEQKFEVEDVGVFTSDSVDYPDLALKVAQGITSGKFEKGLLFCGSGIGVAIAANKVHGIRAANCHDVVMARLSREHNNTNVLTMGGRFIAKELAIEILTVWLNTEFSGGRHENRLAKINAIEEEQN